MIMREFMDKIAAGADKEVTAVIADVLREERRFQAAKAAMQGLITRGLFDADPKGAATEALYFADALLAALEKAP